MKSLQIKNLTLCDGQPRIAVSIVAQNFTELDYQLDRIRKTKPDLVEWRIDALAGLPSIRMIQCWMSEIRAKLPLVPLIATFRTRGEGGNLKASEAQYFYLLKILAASSSVDVLDVELRHDNQRIETIVRLAHQHRTKIIMSNHDFKGVPPSSVILNLMDQMQKLHADLAKMAVMPQSRDDVVRFIRSSLHADRCLRIPIVTMAMGNLGKLTRICGYLTGSVITFGSLSQAVSSAAGQIPIQMLRKVLQLFVG